MAHDVAQLDEKCYLEVFQPQDTTWFSEERQDVMMPTHNNQPLPMVRVGEIASGISARAWLVEGLWARSRWV